MRNIMRKLITIMAVLFCFVASAQYTPTGSKTRFVNGIGLGTKSDAAFGVADSVALYARADSSLMFKYKGTARALAYAPVSKTGLLYGNGTDIYGNPLLTFSNDSTLKFRGVPFLQNVSTTQSPEVYSLFLGYGSGEKFKLGTKGYANTGIGLYSLSKIETNTLSEASSNTATGYYSGAELTVGIANTVNGTAALANADSIVKAVSIGWHNMVTAERGDETVSVGANSLTVNKAQSPHTTIGTNVLINNQFGKDHTLGGYGAAQNNVNGNRLTGWGRYLFIDNVSGSDNTGLGDSTGRGLVSGSGNLFLGNRINVGDVSNHIVLAKGDGTVRAMHNDILWNFYDSVKASAFKSTGGIVTGNISYLKGPSISLVMSNTGAGNYNSWQLLGGSTGSTVNWEFSKDNAVSNAFEIAPSTATGGTSFAASIFRLKSNGELTLTALGTGTVQATAGVLSVTSDGRLKNKLGYYNNATDAIMKLAKPQYWKYSAKSKLPKEAQQVRQFGLLADDVHKVLGEQFAPTQKDGYYGMSDRALLGLAIQAIQELKAEIEQLKKK
jgi:hypothetical protein